MFARWKQTDTDLTRYSYEEEREGGKKGREERGGREGEVGGRSNV